MSDIIPDDRRFQPGYLPNTPFDAPHNQHLSVARFREDFPEFADAKTYTNQSVQFFIDLAGLAVIPFFWGRMTVHGQELYTAHMLALRQYSIARAQAASEGGQPGVVPGMPMGLPASKSVSKVSVSYEFGETTMEGWGPWNSTSYGQLYLWYAHMAGTGGYETLAVGFEATLAGRVISWSHGVMRGYYASVP